MRQKSAIIEIRKAHHFDDECGVCRSADMVIVVSYGSERSRNAFRLCKPCADKMTAGIQAVSDGLTPRCVININSDNSNS